MNIKKSVSIFLSCLIFALSPCSFAANVNTDQVKDPKIKDIRFVPDKDIVIDSETITAAFEASKKLENSDKVKRKKIDFVEPDKNSKNALSKELFPDGSPKSEDVGQGKLGLCYFFAVLSTVAEKHPDLIKKNLIDDGNGFVMVKFFNPHNGNPFYIKIQKTVPNLPDKFKFLANDCLWVQMYLKAFVASGFGGSDGYFDGHGQKNYKTAEGGKMDLVMRMLTGKDTYIKNALSILISSNEKLYQRIEKSLSDGGIVTCDFTPSLNIIKLFSGVVYKNGLIRFHAYSIEKVYKDENGQKWITMRNPHGKSVPKYKENGKIFMDTSTDTNGYFTLKFEDFSSQCGGINFGKNEKIKKRSRIKIYFDYMDPVPFFIRVGEFGLIQWGINYISGKIEELFKNSEKKPVKQF